MPNWEKMASMVRTSNGNELIPLTTYKPCLQKVQGGNNDYFKTSKLW